MIVISILQLARAKEGIIEEKPNVRKCALTVSHDTARTDIILFYK